MIRTIKTLTTKIFRLILFLVLYSILTITLAQLLGERLHDVVSVLLNETDIPNVSWRIYYIISGIISLLGLSILCRYVNSLLCEKNYDSSHLRDVLSSKDERSPAVSISDLVNKIAGNADKITEDTISEIVNQSVSLIERALLSPIGKQKIILICGEWGSGKTTSLLLAIEKIDKIRPEEKRFYIYESAFKYTNELRRFERGVLETIKKVLFSQGINLPTDFRKLLDNLENKPSLLLKSTLFPEDTIIVTSEIIEVLNYSYGKKFKDHPFEIVVILDDLDRLTGGDLMEALSFLSILRRLCFIRLVLPVDYAATITQLKAMSIYKPEIYIKKYLPEQTAIRIKSSYKIAEELALQKLRVKNNNDEASDYCSGWGAILFWLIANRVSERRETWPYGFKWGNNYDSTENMPEAAKDPLIQNIKSQNRELRNDLSISPNFFKNIGDGRHFESLLTNITLNDGRTKIVDMLSDEYYSLCVSWIFDFASSNWEFLDISIRDIIDAFLMLDGVEIDFGANTSQFAAIFNCLFGKEIIKVLPAADE